MLTFGQALSDAGNFFFLRFTYLLEKQRRVRDREGGREREKQRRKEGGREHTPIIYCLPRPISRDAGQGQSGLALAPIRDAGIQSSHLTQLGTVPGLPVGDLRVSLH